MHLEVIQGDNEWGYANRLIELAQFLLAGGNDRNREEEKFLRTSTIS